MAAGFVSVNRFAPTVVEPIAVRKSAALNALTVLSALNLGNVIADGFASVNTLLPTVVAPSPVRASAAVVAPVPPLAMASVPVTSVARSTVVRPVMTKSLPFQATM